MANASPATEKPILPIRLASLVSCMFRGVGSVLCSVLCRATFPISVSSPTLSTRIVPWPSTTVVPRSTRLEAYVASSSKSASTVVLFITGSPVRFDSLTCKDMASSSSPSAGISSPVSRTIISPTTTSFRGISCTRPLRITFTKVSSFTAFSRSNFLLASYSKKKPIPVASNIAAIIPIVSAYSFSTIEMIRENSAATRSTLTTGSSNFSRYNFHREGRLGGVNRLTPYFSRFFLTSSSVSPP